MIFMIIVSNNHDESIILVSTTCMHINFIIKIGDQSTLALLYTNDWVVDNRWKQSPIHKIMGLAIAYLLIVTCGNKSNTCLLDK